MVQDVYKGSAEVYNVPYPFANSREVNGYVTDLPAIIAFLIAAGKGTTLMLRDASEQSWPVDRPEGSSGIVRIASAQQAIILELVNLVEEGVCDDRAEARLRELVVASKEVLTLVAEALQTCYEQR
jgi:hypothetical protein